MVSLRPLAEGGGSEDFLPLTFSFFFNFLVKHEMLMKKLWQLFSFGENIGFQRGQNILWYMVRHIVLVYEDLLVHPQPP